MVPSGIMFTDDASSLFECCYAESEFTDRGALLNQYSFYLPVCLVTCLPVCLFASLPVCLSVCLSACLPVCLSACLPVGMPAYLLKLLELISSSFYPITSLHTDTVLFKIFKVKFLQDM
jgi:hypothetical protein